MPSAKKPSPAAKEFRCTKCGEVAPKSAGMTFVDLAGEPFICSRCVLVALMDDPGARRDWKE